MDTWHSLTDPFNKPLVHFFSYFLVPYITTLKIRLWLVVKACTTFELKKAYFSMDPENLLCFTVLFYFLQFSSLFSREAMNMQLLLERNRRPVLRIFLVVTLRTGRPVIARKMSSSSIAFVGNHPNVPWYLMNQTAYTKIYEHMKLNQRTINAIISNWFRKS